LPERQELSVLPPVPTWGKAAPEAPARTHVPRAWSVPPEANGFGPSGPGVREVRASTPGIWRLPWRDLHPEHVQRLDEVLAFAPVVKFFGDRQHGRGWHTYVRNAPHAPDDPCFPLCAERHAIDGRRCGISNADAFQRSEGGTEVLARDDYNASCIGAGGAIARAAKPRRTHASRSPWADGTLWTTTMAEQWCRAVRPGAGGSANATAPAVCSGPIDSLWLLHTAAISTDGSNSW